MNMSALGRFEASLEVRKFPGCPSCATPIPDDRVRDCPRCGTAIPGGEMQIVRPVVTASIPLHARVLLAIGGWLKRLALRLKGD
jgi:hypothetical protein